MEAEELKNDLFDSLKSSGILGSIKSQLRSVLIEQIRNRDDSLFESNKRPSLEDRLLASIFVEYLEAYDFHFTKSVFVPESHSDSWPPFSHDELVQILRLDMSPCEVTHKESCFVQKLINTVHHCLGSVKKQDASTQTENVGPKKLEGWLKEIDDAFSKKLENEKCNTTHSMEERMRKLYQDFDNQVRAQVDAQVSKIREFEINNVNVKEAATYRRLD